MLGLWKKKRLVPGMGSMLRLRMPICCFMKGWNVIRIEGKDKEIIIRRGKVVVGRK